MVLDGADEVVDDVSTQEARIASAVDEAASVEAVLERALAACEEVSCPLAVDGDATAGYLAALERKDLVNEEAGNPSAMVLGVVTYLYNENSWPELWDALVGLRDRGEVEELVESFRFQQPTDGASFTGHVNCLDAWAIHPDIDRAVQLDDASVGRMAVELAAPLLNAAVDESGDACPFFDTLDVAPAPVPIDGGGVPILVIGNRSDPITSFQDSERLATDVLRNGYLIDTDHFQHTVFPRNDCVNDIVWALLFDDELPAERIVTCERQEPTSADLAPILNAICPYLEEAVGGAAGIDEPDAVCGFFVDSIVQRYEYADLEGLLNSTEEDDVEILVDAYLEAVDQAGLVDDRCEGGSHLVAR